MLAFAFSQISRMVASRKPCLANTSPAASTRRCRVSRASSLTAMQQTIVSNVIFKHKIQSQYSNVSLRCQTVLSSFCKCVREPSARERAFFRENWQFLALLTRSLPSAEQLKARRPAFHAQFLKDV